MRHADEVAVAARRGAAKTVRQSADWCPDIGKFVLRTDVGNVNRAVLDASSEIVAQRY